MGTGIGDPEAAELCSAHGYSWATLFAGDINSETWSSRKGVGHGANNPTPEKLDVKKPEVCCWANHLHRVLKRYIETKVPPGTPDAVMAQTGKKKKAVSLLPHLFCVIKRTGKVSIQKLEI
jgi:hypothetical protein